MPNATVTVIASPVSQPAIVTATQAPKAPVPTMSKSDTDADSIAVTCRTCGTTLQLPLESLDAATRMRNHVNTHVMSVVRTAEKSGYLLDMLQFDCPGDVAKWRKLMHSTLDWLIDEVCK